MHVSDDLLREWIDEASESEDMFWDRLQKENDEFVAQKKAKKESSDDGPSPADFT